MALSSYTVVMDDGWTVLWILGGDLVAFRKYFPEACLGGSYLLASGEANGSIVMDDGLS